MKNINEKKYDVVINGRVLTKPLNGIPRFSNEIVSQLDVLLNDNLNVCLVLPENEYLHQNYNKIDVIKLKNKKLWDFRCAEKFAKKNNAIYINLASKGSLYKKSIVLLYDVRPLKLKKSEKLLSRLKFKLSFFLIKRNAKKIVTISDFCKKEIESISKRKDIEVIEAGWNHLQKIESDYSIFKQIPELDKGNYVLCVGSIAPHKNFKWVLECAKRNQDKQFVIVGAINPKLWDEKMESKNNIFYLGFKSDQQLKALMENASLFLFPSIYEGFGMPPLEAMSLSIDCAVSNIDVMREIFSDSVYYITDDYSLPSKHVIKNLVNEKTKKEVLSRYTWENSARKFLGIIRGLKNE